VRDKKRSGRRKSTHTEEILDRDEVGPVLDVIADVDRSDAHDAVEGRNNLHALQLRLRQRHLGKRHLERSPVLVHRTLADEILRRQLAAALQVRARDRGRGLGLLDLRALQRVVELHQELALAHALAVAEGERLDPAARLGPQHHALARSQGAHGLGVVLQAHRLDLAELHRRRAARAAPARPTLGSRAAWALCRFAALRPRLLGRNQVALVLEPPRGCPDCGNADHGHRQVKLLQCHPGSLHGRL
jgi:hypothetical protein